MLDHTLDIAAIALAAEQLGGAQRALDMAVEYAKIRHQFGRADRQLPGDQAPLRRPAARGRVAALGGAATRPRPWRRAPRRCPSLAALVKAYASDTYFHVAAENIQIHGGIGFTWEHDAHLYFKRAKSSELFLGDGSYHRERLATRIGL